MTSLKINKIKLINIRCFDKIKIDFGSGANVITGPNGSGKSTVLTAIGYGLYGSDYLHGTSLKIADLVKRGELKGQIDLDFSTNRGRFTSVHRVSTKTGNSWKVYQSGISEPLAETINESKEFIQGLFGPQIDSNVFKNAIASEQGDITRLLDLTSGNRKDQIRKILGLQNFDITGDHLGKFSRKLKDTRENLERNREILLEVSEDDGMLKQNLTELKSEARKLQSIIDSKRQKFKELEAEVKVLSDTKNEIDLKQKLLETNRKRSRVLTKDIETLRSEVEKIRVSIETLPAKIDDVRVFASQQESQLEQNKTLQKELEGKLDIYTELKENLDTREKLLNTKIESRTNLTTQIKEIENKHDIATLDKQIEDLASKITNRKDRIQNLEGQIKLVKSSTTRFKEEKDTLLSKSTKLRQDFEEQFSVPIDRIEEVKDQNYKNREIVESRIQSLDNDLSEISSKYSALKEKIEITEQTIDLIKFADTETMCPICMRKLEEVDGDKLLNHHSEELIILEKEISEIQIKISKTNDNRTKMINKKTEFEEKGHELVSYNAQYNLLKEWENKLMIIEKELRVLEKQKSELKEDLAKLELDEFQAMVTDKEKLGEVRTNYRKISNDLVSIESSIKSQEGELVEIKDKLSGFNIEEISDDLTKANEHVSILSDVLKTIRESVLPKLTSIQDKIKENIEFQDEIKAQQKILEGIVKKFEINVLNEKEAAYNLLNREIGENNGKLSLLSNERIPEIEKRFEKAVKNKNQITELTSQLDEYSKIQPSVDLIRGIIERVPTSIINKISTTLSARLTQTVQRLLPGRGYDKVIFYPSGEIALYNNGNIVNNSTLSGGEKTVLGLAVRLALADYIAPLQFLILDEPTNHLDRERVQEFVEIVDRENIFQSSTGQLLLVTHRQEFDRNAQQSIRLGIVNGRRKILD